MTPAPTDLMPERIYVFSDAKSIGDLGFTRTDMKDNHVEYVRADLVPRQAVTGDGWQPCGKHLHGDVECKEGIAIDIDVYTEGWERDVVYPPCPCNPKYCKDCQGDGMEDGGDCEPCKGTGWLNGEVEHLSEPEPAVPAQPTDMDAIMALNRLLNDALSSRDGYGDSRKDAETIRRALSAPARERKLVEALREIADSPHCAYKDGLYVSEHDSGYKMGVADGHRYCARIAREVLAAHDKETK